MPCIWKHNRAKTAKSLDGISHSMQTQSRKAVYQDDDILFEVQESLGILLLHCECNRFSHEVYKRALKIFARFKKDAYESGWEEVYTISPNPKFCKLFGAETIAYHEENNTQYEVMRWDLK